MNPLDKVAKPTMHLRVVKRWAGPNSCAAVKIVQQQWAICFADDGTVVTYEWRDLPLVDETVDVDEASSPPA